MHLFSRSKLQDRLTAAFADHGTLHAMLAARAAADAPAVPCAVHDWLAKLTLLQGVPFRYLVPDEAMLPPESIRFFYLNMNWIDALVDGAMSLGRNLTPGPTDSRSEALDRATRPALAAAVRAHAGTARRLALNQPPRAATLQVVSGFLLRSRVIDAYPGLGVNAYPKGETPTDAKPRRLHVLRLEQLGPHSGVLLCLVDGDAVRVDVHEPPEGLHFGLDDYADVNGTITASKSIHTFTLPTPPATTVSIDKASTPLTGVETCFRPGTQRVLMMSALAGLISQANKNQRVDSAVMGFEMTEGVGQVSFNRRDG